MSRAEPTSDAILLDRFANGRDEAAFLELVQRHGPMVLRTCRRFLACQHEADDVFQATFLLLADKAGTVVWQESVGAWLSASARRLALHASAQVSRRRLRERPLAVLAGCAANRDAGFVAEDRASWSGGVEEIERRELKRVMAEALDELPEKYRAAVVLCYLEGKTNEEAARQLGWPAGSMSRRLDRARTLLRQKLARSGLLLVLLALLAVAATISLMRNGTDRPGKDRELLSASRTVRSPHAVTAVQADPSPLIERISSGASPDQVREQADILARKAAWMAEQTALEDPGRSRDQWIFEATRMRLASIDLVQVARNGSRAELIGSARQLEATCIACHEIFRP